MIQVIQERISFKNISIKVKNVSLYTLNNQNSVLLKALVLLRNFWYVNWNCFVDENPEKPLKLLQKLSLELIKKLNFISLNFLSENAEL